MMLMMMMTITIMMIVMMMMMVYRCLPGAVDQWMAKWRPAKGGPGDGDGQDGDHGQDGDYHHTDRFDGEGMMVRVMCTSM